MARAEILEMLRDLRREIEQLRREAEEFIQMRAPTVFECELHEARNRRLLQIKRQIEQLAARSKASDF